MSSPDIFPDTSFPLYLLPPYLNPHVRPLAPRDAIRYQADHLPSMYLIAAQIRWKADAEVARDSVFEAMNWPAIEHQEARHC